MPENITMIKIFITYSAKLRILGCNNNSDNKELLLYTDIIFYEYYLNE